MEPSAQKSWVDRIWNGDRIALAKAITLAESSLPEDRVRALSLLEMAASRPVKSLRLAITGPPGAGKSSLIEALGMELVNSGLRVAVLSVDPSSPRTGGSILGDKTRMQNLSSHPNAFVRPSPSLGASGGVAPRTHEAIALSEAAGYQVILIETVGVGQAEYAVAEISDAVLLFMIPGAGDSIQAMKRGILDVADGIVINKCDGMNQVAAEQLREELEQALLVRQSGFADKPVRVSCCSALTHKGIPELAEYWMRFSKSGLTSGSFSERRLDQACRRVINLLSGMSSEQNSRITHWTDAIKTGAMTEYQVLLHALA